jgi:hypothetical protein
MPEVLMSLDEIQSAVLEVLRDVQTISGRSWNGLDLSAQPIGHLDGFDSLSGVEATVMVEEKLGCGDLEVDSVFVSEDGKRALSVKEIAHRISKLLTASGAKV